MSEHHRGAWGSRDEAVWWPGDQQNMHHQHLINQHHQQQQQQQLVQQQQVQQIQQQHVVQQVQGQQHNDVSRSNSSNVPGQQLFSYKMASSFQNPAGAVTVATTNAGAYGKIQIPSHVHLLLLLLAADFMKIHFPIFKIIV